MDAIDLIAERAEGLEVVFPPSLQPFQQELLATLGVRVRFDRSQAMPTLLTRPRRPTGRTTRELLLEALSGRRELSTAELVEATGRNYQAVVRVLTDLARERIVLRPARGRYRGR